MTNLDQPVSPGSPSAGSRRRSPASSTTAGGSALQDGPERAVARTGLVRLLPANLKPPVPADNEAQFGYAPDTETSPSALAAFQAHAGHLAASGDPRGWDPRQRDHADPALREDVLRLGPPELDGTAWYHPMRL